MNKITENDLIVTLKHQAAEIAKAGHYGWGNTMELAAEEIERLQAKHQTSGRGKE